MHNIENSIERPFIIQSPERMKKIYDSLDQREREYLSQLTRAADERQELVKAIHEADPNINGQAEHLIDDLALYHEQAEAKAEWTTYDYIKESAEKVWKTAKKYKWWIAGAAMVGLGAYGYYSGAIPQMYGATKAWLEGQAWFTSLADKIGGLVGKGTELVGATVESAEAAAEAVSEQAGELMGNVKEVLPDAVPDSIPSDIPTVDPTMPSGPAENFDLLMDNFDKL